MSDLERAREGFGQLDVDEATAQAALENLTRWLSEPEFAGDAVAVRALIASGKFDELVDAFRRVLPFGTGGRRGRVGLGPNRFNPYTLTASAQGHAEWLRAQHEGPLSVVITWDVRRFDDLGGVMAPGEHPLSGWTSRAFGYLAARVYAAAGIDVWVLPLDADRVMSTPELSHAIRVLNASGGLMVSASHNPPDDNGAKVYDDLGGQLVPPFDEQVLLAVAAVSAVKLLTWDEAIAAGRIHFIGDEVRTAYQDAVLAASQADARNLRVAFSPLHGAGLYSVVPVLERAGFDVVLVEEQCSPDGAFPTVPFRAPNPEVPSALELGIDAAERAGAQLLLATDPDADRIGAVVKHGGDWVGLDGNAIAALVVDHALRSGRRGLVVRTEVTTSLVSRLAEAAGVPLVDDLLVGFKYIGELLAERDEPFLAGVEESHGVLVTREMRDKDAAGGALYLAESAALEREQGRTLVDRLNDLFAEHGRHHNRLASLVMEGATGQQRIADVLEAFRSDPPAEIAGRKVQAFRDRQDPSDPRGPIRCATDLASRNVLVFELDGARVVLRPSGTEPKVKIYTEVVGGQAVDALALERALVGVALERVGVDLPRWALAISSLVSVERRIHFVRTVLPAVCASPEPGAELDRQLAFIGEGAAALFADAVGEWALENPTRAEVHALFQSSRR
ncbi:MAG: phospho-sugar mutase [Proteobacteria bacterium]|nr:phospho-sugar mutase [Pseudomonadota bacterium]